MSAKRKITHGVSFRDENDLKTAKERAEALGISFSNYVNQLIRKDLGMPNMFSTISEDQAKYHSNGLKKGEHRAG